jgi:hypothetical protein
VFKVLVLACNGLLVTDTSSKVVDNVKSIQIV